MMESALILSLFLATLIGTLDFGQALFTRQMFTERVRMAVRWGMVHAYSMDSIRNMVRFGQATVTGSPSPYMNLTAAQVSVVRTAGSAANPNDERFVVSIVDYNYKLFSPWIARTFTNNFAVVESAPILYRD